MAKNNKTGRRHSATTDSPKQKEKAKVDQKAEIVKSPENYQCFVSLRPQQGSSKLPSPHPSVEDGDKYRPSSPGRLF